jgi:hypothetical protein
MLGAAHQIAVRRIRLQHHRGAGQPVAVDQNVDFVPVQKASRGRHERQGQFPLGTEVLGMSHQILLHLAQVALDTGQSRELLP